MTPNLLRHYWAIAAWECAKRRDWRRTREASRNSMLDNPPETWTTGVPLVVIEKPEPVAA
jgi:hypothetical protein